jgi:hypothetical protein
LTAEQIEELSELALRRLGNPRVRGFPVAIRRFRDSYERHEPDDPERLFDLAIALEALLLNDEETKEQLRFRLSLRAARFLEIGVKERMLVFETVRDLYDMRSKIAHGATISSVTRKEAEKLDALSTDAPRLTRRIIAKMLRGDGPTGLTGRHLTEWWRKIELA